MMAFVHKDIVCLVDIFYCILHTHFSLPTSCWRPSASLIHESFCPRCTWAVRTRSTHAERLVSNSASDIQAMHALFFLTWSIDISITFSSSGGTAFCIQTVPLLSAVCHLWVSVGLFRYQGTFVLHLVVYVPVDGWCRSGVGYFTRVIPWMIQWIL